MRRKTVLTALLIVGLVVGTAAGSGAEPREGSKRKAEQLRLQCRGGMPSGKAAVGCRWSKSSARDFARYDLVRETGGKRAVVFSTRDRNRTDAVDKRVAAGTTYAYVILAVNERGKVTARSKPARVACCEGSTTSTTRPEPKPEPRPEPKPEPRPDSSMRLACTGRAAEGRSGVACRWSPSESERFAGYKLYRETHGSGSPRAIILQRTERGETGYLDTDVARAATYSYTIEAVDAAGAVIARGGPAKVSCCSESDAGDAPKR